MLPTFVQYIILILLLSIDRISCSSRAVQVQAFNTSLNWLGGTQLCDSCSVGFPARTYACSPGSWQWDTGFWNNGTIVFEDPGAVNPADWAAIQVSVTLYGQFDCIQNSNWQITRFQVYLQGNPLGEPTDIQQGRACQCPNCVDGIPLVSSEYLGGFPNYTYGNNTLEVRVTQNALCLSSAFVTVLYSKVSGSNDPSQSDPPGLSRIVMWLIGAGIGLFAVLIVVVIIFLVRRAKSKHRYERIVDLSLGNTSMNLDDNDIILGVRIGKGSYGEVFKAEWRGITVAVKRLPYHLLENPDFMADFQKEAGIMSSLRHPNCLQFLGTCKMEDDICIVTEYMAKGSLYQLLHIEDLVIPYSLVRKIALDVAQGMNYLHNLRPFPILHRDLKSHNLLVDESWKVKISDFGLSKVVETLNGTMTSCGTPAWAAPEVLKNSHYTEKADVYSFGICLWEFWTRRDPYEGMPTFQIIFAVGNQGERPTIPVSCPTDYAALMCDCWAAEAERRPSFTEIVQRLKLLEEKDDSSHDT